MSSRLSKRRIRTESDVNLQVCGVSVVVFSSYVHCEFVGAPAGWDSLCEANDVLYQDHSPYLLVIDIVDRFVRDRHRPLLRILKKKSVSIFYD